MTFAHPAVAGGALAFVACAIACTLTALRRNALAAVRYSSLPLLVEALDAPRWPARALAVSAVLGAALLVLSAGEPRAAIIVAEHRGALVLCIDTSGSMRAGDVRPTRAFAARQAAHAVVRSAPAGVAIGVVSFAGAAHLLLAPTTERARADAAIDAVAAPNGPTAIGDALRAALGVLPAHGGAAVLITDGVNNTGSDPATAIEAMHARGVRLYALGIGAPIDSSVRRYAVPSAEELGALALRATTVRREVDLSFPAALAGGAILAITLAAGVCAGRWP